MANEGIRVTGLKELIKATKAVDRELPKEIRGINKDAALALVPIARGLVPVQTGRLQASIRAGATLRSGTVKAGKASVPWANPIHWGWHRHNISPQPFLVEALQGNTDVIRETYITNLQAFLDRTF